MRIAWRTGPALCLSALLAASPPWANRLTFEVWPDASPDHAVFCSVLLRDGWISLVRVTGAGLPNAHPMRWRASRAESEALLDSLLALLSGRIASIDPTGSREPPAPFLTVTWMTRLDGRLASGLYMQPGLALPGPLGRTLAVLGLDKRCGVSATAGE